MTKEKELLDPIPPGEILYEEFLKPLGLSVNQLARDLDVPQCCSSGLLYEFILKTSMDVPVISKTPK